MHNRLRLKAKLIQVENAKGHPISPNAICHFVELGRANFANEWTQCQRQALIYLAYMHGPNN
jgi:hypothetical protein